MEKVELIIRSKKREKLISILIIFCKMMLFRKLKELSWLMIFWLELGN